jgi:hypothetical protein
VFIGGTAFFSHYKNYIKARSQRQQVNPSVSVQEVGLSISVKAFHDSHER